ncbi:hypothetical protein BGZ80_005157 [Entomortierella chlamydospora]|uniref:Uncharacterized protein n=1 Tax=Entomortierella chlamydospora TaxID=101097 RepID=A0A9P6T2H4_9FUNG|nr:hypothetical protein BGZ80_005157 [Entomortierella chlamydospora]
MAEQAPSRLSKSRLNHEADEEEETFLREPAPVPPPEDFFKAPAKSFDINSIPHHKDEFGIAIRKQQNDELGEDNEEEQSLQSSLPGSLKVHPFASAIQTNRTRSESSVQGEQEVENDLVGMRHQFPGSLIDPSFRGDQIGAVNTIRKSTNWNTQSSTRGDATLETTEDIYPNIQKDQSSNEHLNSNGVQQEATTSTSLFPRTQDDQRLVLSGPLGSIPYQEPNDEEEDIMAPLPPLSEISIMPPLRDETGLPFSSTVAAESTFLENANLQRWDLFDNSQSDVYLDDGFIFPRNQGSRSLETHDTKHDANSRISPFAAYISSDSQKEVESSGKPNGGLEATSNRDVDRRDDGTGDDKVDVAHILETLAGAAASSELMKKFLDKDSGDETNSTGNAEEVGQPQPSSQKKVTPSSGSALDNHSSSEDGLTFDEGAGVGVGFKPIQETHPVHESIESDSMESEPLSRRFTAAEKGKQVDRDSLPTAEIRDRSVHDFPLIGSINDSDLNEIKEIGGAIFSMLKPSDISKPTAVSPRVSQSEELRTQIYPTAPPEPWASKPLDNRLSQRRPPSATTRTEVSEHDPNLGFMSSARKHTPVVQPAPTGTKSLLSDYPDAASKSATVAQPTVTLPSDPSKAPVLRGHYELPSIKKIDQWKSKHSLAPNSFRRLLINIGALIASNIIMKARIYRSVVTFLSSLLSPLVFYWIEWAVLLLLLFNIAEVIYSYTQSTNNFENLPLTPSQRSLLGLDPIVSKVPGAVPVFKKSATLPHNLAERPIMSTYVSPSHGAFTPTKPSFQKASVASAGLEYKDATIILNKSMSRSFNQSAVQDKADLSRLMRNIEAREELQAEWKSSDADPAKRPFGLHGSFGAPQGSLQTGVDMSVPDLLASVNSRGPVNRYQPALRTTLSKDHTSKTDLQKDGLYVVGYGKVLKNLKVSEHQLDRWAFNLRKWLWNKVVKHVCSEMEIVDAELARQGLSYLDCKSATMFYASVPLPQNTVNGTSSTAAAAPTAPAPLSSSLAWGAASIANTRLPSAFATTQPQQPQLPTSLQDLEARYGESRIVKQRIYLESYLAVPGYANRKYVVERLQAMGPLLTHFIWDSHGVTWDGGKKTWSPDLPSDSQIIMHLFMTYIDSAMPSHPSQVYDRFPFTYKHYVPVDNKPDPTTALQIKQTSKSPPNYSLVVEGSMWEVVPKRLNVWYTMVLFIYMVMKENSGYIGQINIGTQMIGLGDVVEGYDM